jgi:beta-glucosidase
MYKLQQLDSKYPEIDLNVDTNTDKSKKINREAAGQSNVLLKNENNVLPITKAKYNKIAIIGNGAFPTNCNSIGDCSCVNDTNKIFHGHLGLGYGSGTTTFTHIIDPLNAIKNKALGLGITTAQAGENLDTATETKTLGTTTKTFNVANEQLTEAETVASNADIDLFIVFIMADSGEQYIELEKSVGDRYDMDAWHDGNNLVQKIIDNRTVGGKTRKIIVVINAPGPINLPFLSNVDGIIFSGMGGAESGNGLVDVLFGDLNPSGHLPYVWGTKAQYPADFDILSNPTNYEYSEGVFIGQRWFDKKGYTPIFPFGFGLSYTTFSFSDISASYDSNEKKLTATFKVKNTGSVDGDAVPMLFLKFPDSVASDSQNGEYPSKLFKGFEKVFVKAGETNSVTITVDEHALSYYSVSKSAFVLPSGTYKVYIGHNARELESPVDVTV